MRRPFAAVFRKNSVVNDPECPRPSAGPAEDEEFEECMSSLKFFIYVGAIFFSVSAFFGCFKTVPAGHIGVVKRFGLVLPDTMDPGLNTKIPFIDYVHNVDCRMSSVEYYGEAFSSDLQVIYATLDMQYSIAKSLADEMIVNIGKRHQAEEYFVHKSMAESLKAATCNYTAEELVTSRPLVKAQIEDKINTYLQDSVRPFGMDQLFVIDNLALTNFHFSPDFNAAIEAKVKAEQDALKAVQEKTRRITLAEAWQEQIQIAADAEAYQIITVADAKAAGIILEAQALADNPELLQLRGVERWDGDLPSYLIGSGNGTSASMSFPIIDLSG